MLGIKQRLANWLLRGVHLDEVHIGDSSVVITGTEISLPQAPSVDTKVPRARAGDILSGRFGVDRLEFTVDKLLKGAGVGADPTPIDVPAETGNSILEKLQKHLGVWWFNNNWLPAGMVLSAVSGSGSFAWATDFIESKTGTTLDSYAQLKKIARGLSYAHSWDKKRFFGAYVYFGSTSLQNIHIVSGVCPDTGAGNTYCHIGFKVIDGTLYGTVADGTTEATLSLETLTEAADKYFDFYEARTFQEE